MKKYLLTIIAFALSFTLFAQSSYIEIVRSTIKTEKKALIAEVMQLSGDEGSVFWPIYNEYEEKLYKINTDYFEVVKEFADNYESMSAEVAADILGKASKVSLDKAKLEKSYIKKISKAITPQKALRYFQASNKIEIMIEAELAAEIPLLESIE
jgi:hypothetical protein